jgi:hypothetical protein
MTENVKLKYTQLKGGVLYWNPSAAMKAKGFQALKLGPDGPATRARAEALLQEWEGAKDKPDDLPASVLPGSFEAYWRRFQKTKKFARMQPRTREDYHRGWKHIGPALGTKPVHKLSAADCEEFIYDLQDSVSPNERYRTVKVLRALLEDAIVRLQLPYKNPAKVLPNPQVKGRSSVWLGAEIAKLITTAETMRYPNMAVAIAIGWDTLFSPVDVWNFTKRQIKVTKEGVTYIHLDKRETKTGDEEGGRQKTGKEAFGYLTEDTARRLREYIASLPFKLGDDDKVIRERSGVPFPDKDRFAKNFRRIRNTAFRGDERCFMDMRRSANVEADLADADAETMGQIMANNIAKSTFLRDTYTPPTVAKAQRVAEQRLEGRKRLAGELTRLRTANVK